MKEPELVGDILKRIMPNLVKGSHMKHIVIHGGRAHRDEFYAVGLALYIFGMRAVYRREPTPEELDDPKVIILDVGRRYEPELMNFDHHQLPRGTMECALSLLAKNYPVRPDKDITFHELWEDAPWYRGVVMQDSLGLKGMATHLGLPKLPEELVSGIEIFCLQGFASGNEVTPEWLIFADDMVAAKVRTAIEFLNRLEEIRQNYDLKPFPGGANIFWVPELKPFAVNRFIEREKIQNVVVTVTKDPRSGGLCLYRMGVGEQVFDFSKFLDEKKEKPIVDDVIFAHGGGYMCTVKAETPFERVSELLEMAANDGWADLIASWKGEDHAA